MGSERYFYHVQSDEKKDCGVKGKWRTDFEESLWLRLPMRQRLVMDCHFELDGDVVNGLI